jgi:acyl dehydratase
MTTATVRYRRAPATLPMYLRGIFTPREPLLPVGVTVPPMSVELDAQRIDAAHLARYRQICGFPTGPHLPITYPHVLALPLHLKLMCDPRFGVRLVGLVHIAQEIEQLRPMPVDGRYAMRSWVDGHRDTDRGQEIDLWLEASDAAGVVWRDRLTLLARRAVSGGAAARLARETLKVERPPAGVAPERHTLRAPADMGRRYGFNSGDINPIHMADGLARRFGFERAVAHGMWSLSRSLAALDGLYGAAPCRVTAQFKLPVFLPATLQLDHWAADARRVFVLRDEAGSRPHLAGAIEPVDA